MFRSHVILIAMVALASVASGLAQTREISIDSKVSPEQIKEWLQSSYPIQVAWGAYSQAKATMPSMAMSMSPSCRGDWRGGFHLGIISIPMNHSESRGLPSRQSSIG
jgi:hypothetical protein